MMDDTGISSRYALQPTGPEMTVDLAGRADVGRERDHQEDAFDAPQPPFSPEEYERGVLLIVADGVGGARAGEEASRLAVEITRQTFTEQWSPDTRYTLESAIAQANAAVYTRGREEEFSGMGTTIVCAVLRRGQLYVAHVGDSRLYRLRGGWLEQLTVDHSWVQEQVNRGVLTEDQARNHPKRHIVSRSLGARATVEVELGQFNLRDGDTVLLCSDGLYEMVGNETIAEVMTRLPLPQACERLIAMANEAGGTDNITVVLAVAHLRGEMAPSPRFEDEEATQRHRTVDEEQTAERRAASRL